MNTGIKTTTGLLLIALAAGAPHAAGAEQPVFKAPVPAPAPNLAPARSAPAAMPALQGGNRARKAGDSMECLLEPSMIVNVGSPVEGTLSQVLVDRGADVRKGQVVARLNSSVEEATVALRQAQAAYGQRKVLRNEELFRKDLISASDKDELETQTRLAGLELRQQQEVLRLRTIVSPINGVVVERLLAPGDHISQEKILKLAQLDPLHVQVVAPAEMFGTLRRGMTGEVELGALGGARHKATVTVVDRLIDAASGTFGVRLELRNPGNRIPAGMRCGVRFNR